jgi:hypothetical protein
VTGVAGAATGVPLVLLVVPGVKTDAVDIVEGEAGVCVGVFVSCVS